MLNAMLNALFGCTHDRTTFPLTPGRNLKAAAGAHRHGTYVVCLDCGQEFRYDWTEMRIGEPVRTPSYTATAESFSPANQ
jgi:RNase P subunit RPR2